MMIYGWKRWKGPPGEAEDFFVWVPRMEQLEMFPQSSELTSSGTDAILDTRVSVSALEGRRTEL